MSIVLNLDILGAAGSVLNTLKGVGKAINDLSTKGSSDYEKLIGAGKKMTLALAGTAVAVGAKTVKMAADFQTGLTSLQTGAGESASNMKLVGDGILNMAGQVGESTKDLTDGLYHIESAGYRGAAGLDVLKIAAMGAKVGSADLDTMGKTLTGTMNSYGIAASGASSLMNQLIATTAAGDMKMEDLASSLGNVAPVAAAAKVSFAEVGGAIATMTAQNMSAQQATEDIAFLIRGLQNPSEVATKQMAAMGLSSNQVAQDLGTKGLTGTLEELTTAITRHMGPAGTVLQSAFNTSKAAAADANEMLGQLPKSLQAVAKGLLDGAVTQKQWTESLKGMSVEQANQARQFAAAVKHATSFNDILRAGGPAAQTYTAALSAMTGGATGLNAALMLSGSVNGPVFEDNVKKIAAAATTAGGSITGWSTVQKTFNQKIAEAKGQIEAIGIKIGTALLPAVTRMVSALETSITWLMKHKAVAEIVAGVLGGVLALALTAYAVKGAIAVGTTIANTTSLVANRAAALASALATRAMAAAQWLLDAAMDANPIMLVVAALVAIGAAMIYAYKHSAAFRELVQRVFHDVAEAALWLWHSIIEPVADGITTAAVSLYQNGIRPVFDATTAIVRTTGQVLLWLWLNVAEPVFRGIGSVVAFLWNDFVFPILTLIVSLLRLVAAVFYALWTDAVAPALHGIADLVSWLWESAIKPIFGVITTAIRDLGNVALWLWHNAVAPAMKGVGDAGSWMWNNVLKPTFGFLKTTLNDIGTVVMWLWHNVAEPAFKGIGNTLKWIWDNVIKPVLDTMKQAFDDVGGAIKTVGSGFKDVTGFVSGGVNKISSMLGFADGGPVPGPKGAPRLAVVHGGEYVLSNDMLDGRTSVSGGLGPASSSGPPVIQIFTEGSLLTQADFFDQMQQAYLQNGGRFSSTFPPYLR